MLVVARPCARRLARCRRAAGTALRMRRLARGRRTIARRAAPRCGVRVLRERPVRGRGVPFPFERMLHRRGAARRRPPLRPRLRLGEVALRLLSRARRRLALFWRWELHTSASRLGEANRDGLLRRSGAVLTVADVLHLLAHELTGLRARRLPFALVLARAFDRFSFRHHLLPVAALLESHFDSTHRRASRVLRRARWQPLACP